MPFLVIYGLLFFICTQNRLEEEMELKEFFLKQLEQETTLTRKVIERVRGATIGNPTPSQWRWAIWPPSSLRCRAG